MKMLTLFEQVVLTAIIGLRTDAYGVLIMRKVSEKLNRTISVGQLYTTLDRLERQGYIESYEGEPTKERGGRRKRFFKICAPGVNALNSYVDFMDKNISELQVSMNFK